MPKELLKNFPISVLGYGITVKISDEDELFQIQKF